jgi:hypothetical protein
MKIWVMENMTYSKKKVKEQGNVKMERKQNTLQPEKG